ncbi:c-1-tetrahydrofolate synthase, cytoplasmic [Nephila pilipes]|uniref:C-1-tetrahydrofolate synthase, cytoplasmic n=1 Tax=Nephila pilipes TaxID=299642 RepID=A0A8X6NGZ4_NEPPI|nr:c-1-tetrahydrofolate synthase, cytoplasmic [Nephila pilipes]
MNALIIRIPFSSICSLRNAYRPLLIRYTILSILDSRDFSCILAGHKSLGFRVSYNFSRTLLKMPHTTSNILCGREASKDIQKELQEEVKLLKEKNPDFEPVLAIVQVGAREDSNVYIRMKKKVAAEVGVTTKHVQLLRSLSESEILAEVQKLNEDSKIHGIIVQLPLDTDKPVDAKRITNAVSPSKDVDGICDENAGRLSHGELEGYFIACTPLGCLELIKRSGVTIKGSNAVVIGRSKIVGLPMALLLLWHHATVTICHSRTKDLKSVVKEADIIVAAVGQAQMVKKDWVKPGAVVIDCGINSIKDETKKSGYRLVGDVHYEEVKDAASWITPVPGGVGPMTVIMLVKNTVSAAKQALQKSLSQ